MNFFLTGGSGFVGLNITEELLTRGDHVILFSTNPIPLHVKQVFSGLPGSYVALSGDVTDYSTLNSAFNSHPPDIVIHAAAVTPAPSHDAEALHRTIEVNVLGTLNVLKATQHAGVNRVVILSSASVYGANAFGDHPLDEQTTAPLPETGYAISKWTAERLSLRFGVVNNLEVVVARVGTAFGPWEYPTGVRETLSPIFQITRLALRQEAAVLPRAGHRDWIYSRDIAAAIVALATQKQPVPSVINIAAADPWTSLDWCELLAQRYPDFQFELASLDEASNVDFHGTQDRSLLDNDVLVQHLGFIPHYNLAQAFDNYMMWLETHRSLVLI